MLTTHIRMKSVHYHAITVFLLGVLLAFSLYVGLPYDFSDDLASYHEPITSMSYGDALGLTMNPLTPAWFYMTEIERLRPVYNLIYKLFFDLFGLSLIPFHVMVALGNGLLCAFFFIIGTTITEKKLFGWFLALLYASFSTNAPELIGQLATALPSILALTYISAIACLGLLTYRYWPSKTTRLLLAMGWILLTWFAIKWKSHAKLLPVISAAFLVFCFRPIVKNIGKKMLAIVILVNLTMFVLVVPITLMVGIQEGHSKAENSNSTQKRKSKDQRMFDVNASNIIIRLVKQPGSENPLTKIFLREPPRSLTGNLGFFLGWFFWLSLLIFPWTVMRLRKKMQVAKFESFNLLIHFFYLTLVYFGVIVGSFASGAAPTNVRFLDLALVPTIVLLAFLIRFAEELYTPTPTRKKVLSFVLSVFFIFAIAQNTSNLLKWVAHFGGIQHALVEVERSIYMQYFGHEPRRLDLYLRHKELEHKVVLVTWYDMEPDWYESSLKKISEEGALFLKARSEDDDYVKRFRTEGFNVEIIGVYPFNKARPLMFKLHRFLTTHNLLKMKDRKIILYKISL